MNEPRTKSRHPRPAPPEPPALVRQLPLLLFAVFALFWSGAALAGGMELAVLPSAVVLVLLLLRALLPRRRPASAPRQAGPAAAPGGEGGR